MRFVAEPRRGGYDTVIIGAGSAGAVLAARFAEDRSHRVLLIEAGGANRSITMAMPAAMGLPLTNQKTNYMFQGAPEDGLQGRSVYQPRGRGLGGSSSVNGMNWVRGNRGDYDGWASLGLPTWGYDAVLPYFKKAETFIDGGSAWRGGSGPVKVERSPADNVLFEAFLEAGQRTGERLNLDHNAADQSGMHRIQRNIGDGRRQSTSYAYLGQGRTGENLDVMLHSRVDRLHVQDDVCVGLEIKRKGRAINIQDVGRVILSGGALLSPKLLMLSGIGDADALRHHDIASKIHLPVVGKGLADHPCFCLQFSVHDPRDSIAGAISPLRRLRIGVEWLLTRKGIGASNHFEAGAFLSTTNSSPYPDVQIECVAMGADFGSDVIKIVPGYQFFLSLQRPDSTGEVALKSADPAAAPAFHHNYLRSEHDRMLALQGLRKVLDIARMEPLAKKLGGMVAGPRETDNGSILDWALNSVESNYHPSCTLPMGHEDTGAVDENGKVHGTKNLYVCDASIMPRIPTANLNAPVIMMAEKIAVQLRGK